MHRNKLFSAPLFLYLPLIIFIEGFSSIAIEILTIRQLLPFAGGNVVVTSLIIGIFLLFLALGYNYGGKIENQFYQKLCRNFFIVAIWVGFGISYFFVDYFFNFTANIFSSSIMYSLLAYLLLIIAPAIFLLGQTLPIIINIARQNERAGLIAGKVLGLSTIGSFLGATFTSLVLMNYLGVSWTIFIVFFLLIVGSLIIYQPKEKIFILMIFSSIFGCLVYFVNVDVERNKFLLTNNYANYEILNNKNSSLHENERILIINKLWSSYTDGYKKAFPYINKMATILFEDLQLTNQDILVLGAGGFTLSQVNNRQNNFTYVDIDQQIRKVVVPEFIAHIKDKLIVDDARHFLSVSDKKYRAIIVDTYSNLKTIPAHLLTQEFMQQVKNHLMPDGGYALFNIIAHPFFSDAYSKHADNTIRSVFGSCTIAPMYYSKNISNMIYVCTNLTKVEDFKNYTDDLNASTIESFEW